MLKLLLQLIAGAGAQAMYSNLNGQHGLPMVRELQRWTNKGRTGSSGLWSLLGGAVVATLGGTALRHIDATKLLLAPTTANQGRKQLSLAGPFLGIGSCNREKLEQANALETLQTISSTKDLELEETKAALAETLAALQDLQERFESQRVLLISFCIVLAICVVGLVIAGLCQRMKHLRERHTLFVEHNCEREESLKETLRQKIAVAEQQKESLKAASEERSVQLQQLNSLRSAFLSPGHQPLVFNIPSGLAHSSAILEPTAPIEEGK